MKTLQIRTLSVVALVACVSCIVAQAQVPITNGLVAYYPFHGTARDASGHRNDGALIGYDWQYSQGLFLNTTPFPTNGAVGTGPVGFDGTYVIVPRSAALDFNQDFTLSVWVNIPNGLPSYWVHNLISSGSDQNGTNLRIISDATSNPDQDYLEFVGNLSTNYFDIHAHVPPIRDTWWQVVVVRSGIGVSLFSDGVLLTNSTMIGPVTLFPEILIGKMDPSCPPWCPTAYYSMVGGIQDVRMYDRALSTNEVLQIYRREKALIR